jgi:hypothetical protein
MTLEQYSKGFHTPTSVHPLGTHPYRCPYLYLIVSHERTTLTSAQPLGSRSLVLIHRHVHSAYHLFHCITQGSHLEFIISTLCLEEANTSSSSLSHDDAPSFMGIHTFTLCSATSMSNSTDLLSPCITQENHLELLSTLCKEEVITTFQFCLR